MMAPLSRKAARVGRRNMRGRAGLLILCCFGLTALLAPWLAPYPPLEQHLTSRLELPNAVYWLGTDMLGRDILSRMIYGTRTTFSVALTTITIGITLGCTIGALAAFLKGTVDVLVMRLVDFQLALPGTIFVLVLIAVIGSSTRSIIVALSIGLIPLFSRVTRASMNRELSRDYIIAAEALGISRVRLAWRHVLPNVAHDVLTQASLVTPGMLTAEAGLTFIGLGVSPAQPSWGRMIAEGLDYVFLGPHMILVPVVALSLATVSAYLLSDNLQAHLDPRAANAMDGLGA